ncbi:MAG: hypothetical protein AMXMBFR64_05090 [Myxococcales bacterium]
MKLFATLDGVWSLDEDLDWPDDDRHQAAPGADGQTVDAGRILPLSEAAPHLRPGAIIWTVRRMTATEWEHMLSERPSNATLSKAHVIRARAHGSDEVLAGEALLTVLEGQGLALLGDLAAFICRATLDRGFRCRGGQGPGLG